RQQLASSFCPDVQRPMTQLEDRFGMTATRTFGMQAMMHAFSDKTTVRGLYRDAEFVTERMLKQKTTDFTVVLPPEVATHVFSFLDTHTLMQSCSLVSKRWNRLVDDPYVWQHLFQNQYGPWKHKP